MTEQTKPDLLSDEQIAEIEARAKTYYCNKCGWFGTDGPSHPNCNYHAAQSSADRTIAALCQTVRALRSHNLDLRNEIDRGALCEQCDEWEYNEDGSCRTFTVCGACWNKLQETNTALREQLAQIEKENQRLQVIVNTPPNERAVCDCHTWPTISEMHDYTVAIEQRARHVETCKDCQSCWEGSQP